MSVLKQAGIALTFMAVTGCSSVKVPQGLKTHTASEGYIPVLNAFVYKECLTQQEVDEAAEPFISRKERWENLMALGGKNFESANGRGLYGDPRHWNPEEIRAGKSCLNKSSSRIESNPAVIEEIQRIFVEKGYLPNTDKDGDGQLDEVDGVVGTKTRGAIKKFNRVNGTNYDFDTSPIAFSRGRDNPEGLQSSPASFSVEMNYPPSSSSYDSESSGLSMDPSFSPTLVRKIQDALIGANCLDGKADGVWADETEGALQKFSEVNTGDAHYYLDNPISASIITNGKECSKPFSVDMTSPAYR